MQRLQNQLFYFGANALRRIGYDFNEEANEQVAEMKRSISALRGGIQFSIEQHPDGSWSAESKNIDGIITGGTNPSELPETIKDAIFTYFEIPPQYCNDALLKADNEPVTLNQSVRVSG